MKIGVNLISLLPGISGGMEQLVRNLVDYLAEIPDVEVRVYLTKENREYFKHNKRIIVQPCLQNTFSYDEIRIDAILTGIDIFICPLLFCGIINMPIPVIAIFPDTQDFEHPEFFEPEILALRHQHLYDAIRATDMILTISEYSKNKLVEYAGAKPEKVEYFYLDADKSFLEPISQAGIDAVKEKYKLPDQYIYYPANAYQHKNHLRLIEAFKELIDDGYSEVKLMFSGADRGKLRAIKEKVSQLGIQDKVVYLGYVDQKDLPAIFACALFVAFPSLYEGFGIPIVEAMKSNRAVALSKIACLPEIAEDAGLYFDPMNISDIQRALKTMMDENIRAGLIKKGNIVKQKYSWGKSCEKLLNIFDNLIRQKETKKIDLKISAVISCRRDQDEWTESLMSVITQDYKNVECMILSDNIDEKQKSNVLSDYKNVVFLDNMSDESETLASAISQCRGDIIVLLRAGDILDERACSTVIRYFNNVESLNIAYGKDKKALGSKFFEQIISGRECAEEVPFECGASESAVFFSRNLYKKVYALNGKTLPLKYDLWLELSKKGNSCFVPYNLVISGAGYPAERADSLKIEYFLLFKSLKRRFGIVEYYWAKRFIRFILGKYLKKESFFKKGLVKISAKVFGIWINSIKEI